MTSASPKPKRRWFQFSLRTFFVLLTICCVWFVWFGWWMYQLREQRKAVEAIKEFGAEVSYHYSFGEGGDVRHVKLDNTTISDLTPLARFKNLEKLLDQESHL